MSNPINETMLTLTLPAYAWAALRGAARRAERYNARRAERGRPVSGINLDADRAGTLEYAAEEIEALLKDVGL